MVYCKNHHLMGFVNRDIGQMEIGTWGDALTWTNVEIQPHIGGDYPTCKKCGAVVQLPPLEPPKGADGVPA